MITKRGFLAGLFSLPLLSKTSLALKITTEQVATVAYKGSSAFEAGTYYCPYVPLQVYNSPYISNKTKLELLNIKTRYGDIGDLL